MADPLRKAQKLEKKGDYERAAEIYASLGETRHAIDLLLDAEQYDLASELMISSNRVEEAINLYLKRGQIQKALNQLKKQGDFFRAAMICKQQKQFREAAALFEKCGILSEAARMYAEERDYKRAAELYLRSNMMQSAAESYESAVKELEVKANPFSTTSGDVLARSLWLKAAKAWELVPNPEKAGKIYQDLMEWELAGTLYESIGNFRKALFCFEQSDNIDKTLQLLKNLNMHEKAAKLMAVKAESSGDLAMAAQFALQQKDYAKAAEYYERLGDFRLAAENYEKSQAFLLAAEAYFKADDIPKAARMYRIAGNLDTAAKLYEQLSQTDQAVELHVQSQNFCRGAELLLEAEKTEEALRLLLRVPEDHPSQRTIRRLKAIAYFRLKKIQTGFNFVSDLLEQPVSADNIDVHYEYANALQEEGRLKESLVAFQRIVDHDKNYKNALKCLNWCAAMEETLSAKISDTVVGELPIGIVIAGRYELLELLGKGGMGVVYRAADRELNLAVALKILRPKLSYDPDFIEMFKREVTLARMLSHPNIIKIYDLNRMGNMWFVSMEYLQGEEVKDVIIREGKLASEQVQSIGMQILSALSHSHSRNLIHSDVKPQNIFLDEKGHATLVDFGIARTMSSHSKDQIVYGTPGYISPEQITGDQATPRSDIYSLGVSLYEMVTGRVPFEEETMDLILESQLKTDPPPPSHYSSEVPKWMDNLIIKMMARKPLNRFASADDVLAVFPKS
ncbi:protein kinase [bacterium]|nr:protein kinase [candidate division CSSED10-310 bacterium]